MEATRRLDHPGPVGALSATGDLVATGTWTGELRMWNARKGTLLGRMPSPVGSVRSLGLSEEPPVLLVSGAEGLCALRIGDLGLVTDLVMADAAGATELSVSTDGRAILTANPPVLIELDTHRNERMTARARLTRETLAFAQRCRFSGSHLLISSPELILLLDWRPPYAQKSSFEWKASSDRPWVGPLDLHPDGLLLVAICEYRVLAWTVGTGPRALPDLPDEQAFLVAFSPDGKGLVVGYDRRLELRTAPQWQVALSLAGPEAHITGVAFGRDNLLIASSEDGGAYVWELG